MKKGIRKIFKSILVLTLCITMALQYYHVSAANKEATITFSKSYDEKSNTVSIDAKASCLAGYEITGIQMTGQERKTGASVQVTVLENKDYVFTVFYRVKPVEPTQPVERPKTNVVKNATQVFNSTVDATETELSTMATITVTEIQSASSRALLATANDGFLFDEKTGTISQYDASITGKKDIVIPDKIEGVKVLHIGDNAFSGQQLGTLTFQCTSLKTIGNNAFYNNQIQAVNIPDTVESIGNNAFQGCGNLQTVHFPKALKSIGSYAFEQLPITAIVLPEGLESIGEFAFSGITSVESVIFPSTLKTMGRGAFQNSGIKSITFTGDVTTIDTFAFFNCYNLSSVLFQGKVANIEDQAFGLCQGLTTFTIPKGLEVFNRILNRTNLTSLTIPASVTTIQEDVVQYCPSIDTITIEGSGKVEIADTAFSNDAIRTINIPERKLDSVKNAPWGADYATIKWNDGQTAPNVVELAPYRINLKTGTILKYTGMDTNLHIPGSVVYNGKTYALTTIASSAFLQNATLETITMDNTITNIKVQAFSGCSALKSITLSSGIEEVQSRITYQCDNLTAIHIPEGVMSISYHAIESCASLQDITFPSSITRIDADIFSNCNIKTVTILGSGNLEIASSAFSGDAIDTITFPDRVKGSINDSPWGADATEIHWQDVIEPPARVQIGDYVYNTNTKTIVSYQGSDVNVIVPAEFLYNNVTYPVTTIGKQAFINCVNMESITIPEGITKIEASAFENLTTLTKVTLPNTLTSIESAAFASTGILDMQLPSRLHTMNSRVFANCLLLKRIEIPDTIDRIEIEMFTGCKALEEVLLPRNLIELEPIVFSGCTALKSIKLPEKLTTISYEAFKDCKTLQSIKLPKSIINVGSDVFAGCTSIKEIIIPSSIEHFSASALNPAITTIYVESSRGGMDYTKDQPWGADPKLANVYYLGEYVHFQHETNMNSKGGFDIAISASILKGGVYIDRVILPDQAEIRVGSQTWPSNGKYIYHVDHAGVYKFIGKDNKGTPYPYEIEVKEATVTYRANSTKVTGGSEEVVRVVAGDTVTISSETDLGYHKDKAIFLNWNTKPDGTGNTYSPKEVVTLDTDITLYAMWKTVQAEDVHFRIRPGDESLGNISLPTSFTGTVGETLGNRVPIVSENWNVEGATFIGWYKGDTKVGTIETELVGNSPLYEARFIVDRNYDDKDDRKDKYTVTFKVRDSDAGKAILTNTSVEVGYNEKLGNRAASFMIDKETSPNVSFEGWYKDGVYPVSNLVNEVITNDTTYEVRFDGTSNAYRINFQITGEDGTIDEADRYATQVLSAGKIVTVPTVTLKPDKKFLGWYKQGDASQTVLTKEQIEALPLENATYIAKVVNGHTVTYTIHQEDVTLGTLEPADKTTVTIQNGHVIGSEVPTPTPTNDKTTTFEGWYKNDVKVADISKETITTNATYVARFILDRDHDNIDDRKQDYTCTFKIRDIDKDIVTLDGATNGVVSNTVVYGTNLQGKVPTYTIKKEIRDDVTFVGWYKDTQKITDMDSETVTDNVTYEAHFILDRDANNKDDRKQKYTYTFKVRDSDIAKATLEGTKDGIVSGELLYGTNLKDKVPTVTIDHDVTENVHFIGWYLNDKKITNFDTVKVTDNVTYEARFDGTITKARVYFEVDASLATLDGGKNSIEKICKLNKPIGKTNVPVVKVLDNDKKYIGWYKKGDNSQTIIDWNAELPTQNATYVAKIVDVYTVNYKVRNGDEQLGSIDRDHDKVPAGDTITNLPNVTLANDKVICMGWYHDGTKVDLEKEVITKNTTYEVRFQSLSDVDNATEIKVYFEVDGAFASLLDGSTNFEKTIQKGQAIGTEGLPIVTLKDSKKRHIGWYRKDDSRQTLVDFNVEKPDANTTYVAKLVDVYTVTYIVRSGDESLGSISMQSVDVLAGDTIKQLPEITLANDQVEFLGWYYESEKIALDKVKITKDSVFEARFQNKDNVPYGATNNVNDKKENIETADYHDSSSVFTIMLLSLVGIFSSRKRGKIEELQ